MATVVGRVDVAVKVRAMVQNIYWTPLLTGAREPTRAHPDDAGFDLYVAQNVYVQPGEFVDVRSGVAVQLPPGYWGMLTGRSSTLRKRGLLVNPGIIDNGYRGELFAGVWNLGQTTVRVHEGERLAQLIPIMGTDEWAMQRVDQLDQAERGTQGFGSTGV
jgi:dUTP pyrophosphatase